MYTDKIKECFQNIGILLSDSDTNFDLSEYIEDSVTFVSLIIELETAFDISIPDNYLLEGALTTFSDVENAVEDCLASRETEQQRAPAVLPQ